MSTVAGFTETKIQLKNKDVTIHKFRIEGTLPYVHPDSTMEDLGILQNVNFASDRTSSVYKISGHKIGFITSQWRNTRDLANAPLITRRVSDSLDMEIAIGAQDVLIESRPSIHIIHGDMKYNIHLYVSLLVSAALIQVGSATDTLVNWSALFTNSLYASIGGPYIDCSITFEKLFNEELQ